MRRAFITGISGQDGSYLAERLLRGGVEVHGLIRRREELQTEPIRVLFEAPETPDIRFHEGDVTDAASLEAVLAEVRPHEVYNLAAQSHVGTSFHDPLATADVTGLGALRVLEAARALPEPPRVLQASSAEIFGRPAGRPADEETPLRPRNPYGCAKAFAHRQTVNHREAFGLFASTVILFNHESPRRPETFVTRKITRAASRIRLGFQEELPLGNLDAARDWGFAGDYVEAMWLALQRETPGDFVVASGASHTVRDFVEEVFSHLGLDWKEHVTVDPELFRPVEPGTLTGDASRARRALGWTPKVGFKALARMMVEADLAREQRAPDR